MRDPGLTKPALDIVSIFISGGHNFVGRHGKPSDNFPLEELESVECVAGSGLRGDRYFDHKDNYKGQVTFFDESVFQDLCDSLGVYDKGPECLRRNILTRGFDLNRLIGKRFSIQGIEFEGVEESAPCYWMNQAFGRGAEAFLKGRGGLRARILTSGRLSRMSNLAAEAQ